MYYTDEEIAKEIESLERKHPAFAGRKYPIEYLSDREFEILIYFLFKMEIGKGLYPGLYDSIKLMKGVAERGRDSVLVYKGKNSGIIQCKKYAGAITKPALAKEIIKFLLHLIQDPSLIENYYQDKFSYYLIALNGITEPAQNLVTGFSEKIIAEPELTVWVDEVLKENKSLSFKNYGEVKDSLGIVFNKINVEVLTTTEIEFKLKNNVDVVALFFETQKVVSEDLLRDLLKEYNFKGINDEDIKKLVDKLESIPPENRLRMAFVNFYGYNIDFLKTLWNEEKLKPLLFSIAEIKSTIYFLYR